MLSRLRLLAPDWCLVLGRGKAWRGPCDRLDCGTKPSSRMRNARLVNDGTLLMMFVYSGVVKELFVLRKQSSVCEVGGWLEPERCFSSGEPAAWCDLISRDVKRVQ